MNFNYQGYNADWSKCDDVNMKLHSF